MNLNGFLDARFKKFIESGYKVARNVLSQKDIDDAEKRFEITFHPDMREFLSHPLSTLDLFYDYGADEGEEYDKLQEKIREFKESIEFDIEHNNLWLKQWGPKPKELNDQLYIFRKVSEGHNLVPIYSHRAMVSGTECKYVLSAYRSDIIVYSNSLREYLSDDKEFELTKEEKEGGDMSSDGEKTESDNEGNDDTLDECEPDVNYNNVPFWGNFIYCSK